MFFFSLSLKKSKTCTETQKQKIKTNKQNTKKSIKGEGVCVLANYSWVWGLLWTVVDVTSNTPLEKTDFLIASRYQLQTAS